jgi:hypothetical protein
VTSCLINFPDSYLEILAKKISTNMKEILYNVLVDIKCKDTKIMSAKDTNIFGLKVRLG